MRDRVFTLFVCLSAFSLLCFIYSSSLVYILFVIHYLFIIIFLFGIFFSSTLRFQVEVCTSKELLLTPVVVSRNKQERVLIEGSVNSVRISIAVKQADDIEKILAHKFTRFMCQRADNFVVLRRLAHCSGYK